MDETIMTLLSSVLNGPIHFHIFPV